MNEWIDFKELRAKLSFQQIFEKYQVKLQLRKQGKQAIGPCPIPSHAGSRMKQSFSANLEKGIFQCFNCGAKGNVLDFAVLMAGRNPKNGNDARTTALELASAFGIGTGTPPKNGARRADAANGEIIVNAPLDFALKDLDANHPYLLGRKFTPATIAHFGLGFCSRGYFRNRIAIPLHDHRGAHVGYAGRVIDDKLITRENPKYLLPGSRDRKGVTYEFQKSLLLYNADRVPKGQSELIVVEGFPSVWWLHQSGIQNAVALMGNSLSESQVELASKLLAPNGVVLLMLDGNEAGQKAIPTVAVLFQKRVAVKVVDLRKFGQPTDIELSKLRDVIRSAKPLASQAKASIQKERICALANSFPCLQHLRLNPERWDAETFERQSLKLSTGERTAAQFVLSVWNPQTKWECGSFDLVDAASRLDQDHREVVIEWLRNPWWP